MFQYACGRAVAYKHQTELLFDTSQLITSKPNLGLTSREYELNIFNINGTIASKEDIKKIKPLFYRIANILSIKFGFHGIQTSKFFIENKYSFNNSIEKAGKDCFLAGYWQSFRYFKTIETLIKEEFKFPMELDSVNIEWATKIKNENSVCIHIRRTDFVKNKNHDIHGACSIEYYKNALEYISDKVKSPYFFIFSDDIEWARTNLDLQRPCEFISGNIGKHSYIDMLLMSLCKNNIIANSSFSWWGAWLNSNEDKIVIAPKQWFADESMNRQTNDLIPETWIRL
jgi:hypothetical protein